MVCYHCYQKYRNTRYEFRREREMRAQRCPIGETLSTRTVSYHVHYRARVQKRYVQSHMQYTASDRAAETHAELWVLTVLRQMCTWTESPGTSSWGDIFKKELFFGMFTMVSERRSATGDSINDGEDLLPISCIQSRFTGSFGTPPQCRKHALCMRNERA